MHVTVGERSNVRLRMANRGFSIFCIKCISKHVAFAWQETIVLISNVAGLKIWGWAKFFWEQCLTLGEQQYFCVGRCFSKHKMTRYSRNWGHGLLGTPGDAYGSNCTDQGWHWRILLKLQVMLSKKIFFWKQVIRLHHWPTNISLLLSTFRRIRLL